ncbi:DUF2690 domain-containing protein [Actinoplanes sp. NBRC 103695]|uniref:DUF2690 domain-containing protein n=1 Tax=Actinoplanes sp. NBRC 103695 TaxID=3032202 RepID=UPI0024A01B21|nr:DUF2690 domain-containing protein [Actinoplanes sp. NBRC 103695]GLZ00961.1 hypothetical protein Acsp02_82130 [Actinoplanes sp. NBRC 103695]
MRNRRLAALFCGILVLIGLTASATPASAVVHCWGASCNGLRLADTDCHVQAFEITGATGFSGGVAAGSAGVWYSPTCHAMWAVFIITDDGTYNAVLETQPEYGGVSRTPFTAIVYRQSGATSTLVDSQQSVRACFGTSGWCTSWR